MRIVLCILMCLFTTCPMLAVGPHYIIPHPQTYEVQQGNYSLDSKIKVHASKDLKRELGFLKNYLQEVNYKTKTVGTRKSADIQLAIDHQSANPKKESYTLDITKDGIRISGSTSSGVFYGIQSLMQLVRATKGQLPCVHIEDAPAFSWRAFMLDEARHFKGMGEVKKLLDVMAELKMNVFHWHLTDHQGWRIQIDAYPKLTEVGAYRDSSSVGFWKKGNYDGKPHFGFYTKKQIREILAYAADRHINVVPEIDMPGHSTAAIAAYPEMGTTGIPVKVPCRFGPQLEVYDVTRPEVRTFLKNILKEVIELFPSPVIHIGGDEVRFNQWNESKSIQAYMKERHLQTPAELQLAFTNEMSNWLADQGRRMMGWNEITGDKLHGYHKGEDNQHNVSGTLSKNSIVHFWKGDPKLITKALRKGFDIVNSYHVYTYLDYQLPLKKCYSFNPIPEGLTAEERGHILGTGCQMWSEYIPRKVDLYNRVFPNIAAYAEVGWTINERKDYDRFFEALQLLKERWENLGFSNFEVKK